ncbi:hypothetical protein [Curtobacterium sp. MCSS17_007]|uniref:hypothetical protein n=1 Tax=Curtobacterium sp. MCSS17_007 TaxID=2175646 RepID=UPI000DA90E2F|nr:hypothetical protein [Curtobacterium sp. MCSS17_007]WIE74465.1 hypothetical protein DEJ22_009235 [Curtobacterium sp. MCSS17_007]
MKKQIARIISDQVANGDTAVIDALRQLAGMPVGSIQMDRSYVRRRVVEIQRDQNGNVVGSIERIEEAESGSSSGTWHQ